MVGFLYILVNESIIVLYWLSVISCLISSITSKILEIFEKKLFRHYNTNLADFIDISYDEMINKLIDKTNIYGFESIIRSETFRAIIYSYISFPEKKKTNESRNTNINFIIFFFNRLFLYFSTNQLHLVIANSDNQKKYIYRIIISLRIAICHQESWEDYLKKPQIDEYWILAMLQEAILVNSLNTVQFFFGTDR